MERNSTFSGSKQLFNRKLGWLALLVVIVASLAVVMVPAMVIMPFKPQTPRAVELSYWLKSWSPIVTALGLIGSMALAIWLWRGKRSW